MTVDAKFYKFMETIRCFLSVLLLFVVSCSNAVASKVKEHKKANTEVIKCPTMAEFQPIADSILAEGLRLYGYEKVAWMTSDSANTHCKNLDDMGGYVVYEEGDVFTSIYTDKKEENVVFCGKGKLDAFKRELQWSNEVRPLSNVEKEALNAKIKCIQKLSESYGDSIYNMPSAKGNLNIDIIKRTEGYRLYILQGTILHGIIPYGNDYIVDYDNDFNITSFKRCHKGFLALPVESGKKVESSMHSHTPDNPYMSVTDVCTSLLYGRDLYGIQTFIVLSTYFTNGFMIQFTTENMQINGFDMNFLKKIYGK